MILENYEYFFEVGVDQFFENRTILTVEIDVYIDSYFGTNLKETSIVKESKNLRPIRGERLVEIE